MTAIESHRTTSRHKTHIETRERDPERGGLPDRMLEFEREFEGVVLVADMAGYTRFADELVSSGPHGVERLGQVVEQSLQRYFNVVAAYGGKLSSLAGDAVIAHWALPARCDPGYRAVIDQSSACAQDLVRSAVPGQLPVHAGIALGRVWAGSCPGFDREIDSVFGGTATRAAFRLAKQAKAGEAFIHMHPDSLATQLLERDAPHSISTSAITASSGHRDGTTSVYRPAWNAELRPVAALFLRLLGFDEMQAGSWFRHREALALIQEQLGMSAASGRLVIDDLGLVCVSVFGEPQGARLDPPEIVAERARCLIQMLEGRMFPVAAGLAFGRAFCGQCGSERERVLVSVGRVMNLAARLMDAAGRGLVVADLSEARRPAWLSARPARVALRGFTQPVEVLDSETSPNAEPVRALFGREEELARVGSLLFRLREGQASTCLIRGDAGMGKTALLHSIHAKARALELRVSNGHAHSVERAVPYFTWRQILRALFEEAHTDLDSALRQRFGRLDQPAALLPLLNAVFPSMFSETPESERLIGTNRAEATLELLLTLLKDLAREPLVILIDDAHLADSASLELIERIAQGQQHILLFLAARPGAATSELIYRLSGSRHHQIDLRALARDGVAAMARDKLKDRVDVPVLELIEGASEGNPLFVQEYLLLLREVGRIAKVDGRWSLASAEAPGPPESVLAAISSRIHALLPNDQQVLKVASVVGELFSRELLLRVAEVDTSELDVALLHLEHSGLIVRHSLQEGRFGFSHTLVREAAYDLMLSEQRNQIHSSVARILDEQREHLARAALPQLVHHYAAAGDGSRTIELTQLLAADAMRQGAYREATGFLRTCLSLCGQTGSEGDDLFDRRIRWSRELSEALGAQGEIKEGREYAESAVQLAGLRVRQAPLITVLQTLFALSRRILTRPRRARSESRPRRQSLVDRELARTFRQLAHAAYFAGDSRLFAHYVLRGLAHAERASRSPELVQMLALAGACMGYLGLHRTGRRYIRAAAELGRVLPSSDALASAHMASGLYFVGCGDWAETQRHVEGCQFAARSVANNRVWDNAQAIRFWMYCYRGLEEEARWAAQQLMAAAERSGNKQHGCWAQRFLGIVAWRAGALDEALIRLQIARTALDAQSDLNEVAQVHGLLAGILHVRAEVALAEPLAIETLERLRSSSRPTGHAMLESCSALTGVLVDVYMKHPHDPVRRSRAQAAIQVMRRFAATFPVGRARYRYWHAELLSSQGQTQLAKRQRRAALAWAERLQMRYDQQLLADK